MEKWYKTAGQLGFEVIAPLDVRALEPRRDIRAMCALNLCGKYGKCWTCPPVCGDFDTCTRRLKEFSRGILVQTVVEKEAAVTAPERNRAQQTHRRRFAALCREIYPEYPQALCLSGEGCRICESCAWPEPCVHPEACCHCATGFGLLGSQLRRCAGLDPQPGDRFLVFTGCILFP